MSHKLVFGCGYLGQRVAQKWHDAGHHVTVITRIPRRADDFGRDGYNAIVADVTQPETLARLPAADTVLFSVGFDKTAGQSIADVYTSGVRNVLSALSDSTERFIYISTTGVFGPAAGQWVDEATPPDPRRDGGRASLAAEKILAAHSIGKCTVILRLAGIYGPGRVPFLDKLRGGEPIAAPSDGWLNLIHVDDAADAVVAADHLTPFGEFPRIYCVSDGEPVPRAEYYGEVARQISAPPPQFVEPGHDSPRAARAESNRRVSNARMLAELRVTLTYPDYRAGLAAILSP
jgi:nucleoside-diphosphate-sugar epimerase